MKNFFTGTYLQVRDFYQINQRLDKIDIYWIKTNERNKFVLADEKIAMLYFN